MSYLNGPRINFWGGGSTNVDTANNTDLKDDSQILIDVVSATVTGSKTDEELIERLREPQAYYTVAGWNYYGDHQVAFMDAKVSSSGPPGAVSTSGDLVGAPVYLLGSVDPTSGGGPYGGPLMVDLDPTGSSSTQIYAGGFQIGEANAPSLLVRADTVCHSRFLGLRYDRVTTHTPYATPGSVFASGTFQLAFSKDAIVSYDRTIDVLEDIIEAPRAIGIVVRFSMFEFMPGKSTEEVHENYKNNYNDSNPSLGRIIGTVGPWFEDEAATSPPGRLLSNTCLGSQGLAHLDISANRLSLDLVSALQGEAIRQDPAANTSGTPIGPNVDYGDLEVWGASGVVLGSTPSLPDSYYLYGGLFDIGLHESATGELEKNPIAIRSTHNGLKIDEVRLRIYSDDRNIYIDDVGGKKTIELRVTELGGPVRQDTNIDLATGPSGTLPPAGFLDFPKNGVTVSAGSDRASFEVKDNGGDAGFVALNLSAQNSTSFVQFRKYPTDDYSGIIKAGNIPWETVYEDCLRYYYILFPAMSKRIPLNAEGAIGATGTEILKRISRGYRDTTLYMPVTRSMSPGKVALLRAYLIEQGAVPPEDERPVTD